MRIITILFVVTLLSGCTKREQLFNENFDTRTFFSKETERLKQGKHSIIKTLVFNNETRQLLIKDTINWVEELAPFTEIDLKSDAFTQAFQIDSISNGNQVKVTYTNKDEKMELKSVVVLLESDQVMRISYMLYTKNSLYENRKLLEYMSDNGYRITGFQKVKLLSGEDYSVHVSW